LVLVRHFRHYLLIGIKGENILLSYLTAGGVATVVLAGAGTGVVEVEAIAFCFARIRLSSNS